MNWTDHKLEQVFFALAVLAIALIVSRLLRLLIGRFIRSAAQKLKVDPTRYNFFKNAMDFIVFLVAAIIIFRSIPAFKAFGTTLLTGAGVLAAIVGFASQSAFSNIISGFFLVIFKPFSVGDRVRIGQLYMGIVEDITLRHTVIKDFENRRIVIPNSVISNETIINSTLTDEKVCIFIEVPIAFNAPLDKAMNIIREESLKHPNCIDNRSPEELTKGDPQVRVRAIAFGDFGIQLRGYAWAATSALAFELRCDVFVAIQKRFIEEQIEFGYPGRIMITSNNSSPDETK
ncbi:MAG: mechanosensitive ion channel family protein [Cyclobacteriaceae bacterium]|nr:mechanosensitive ion channel family protein [Cyclobacteriaceae bacterium]